MHTHTQAHTYKYTHSLSLSLPDPNWLLNLLKVNETHFEWGDGRIITADGRFSIYHVAEAFEPYFRLVSGKIWDSRDSGLYRIMCQANPRGIEW